MPDIEEMLLGDDEDETTEPKNADWARQRKELKAAQKELEELRAFKAQAEQDRRKDAVAEVFRSIGLKPKHAKFYPTEGDTTEEAIRIWAISEELLEDTGDEMPTPASGSPSGFTPTVLSEGTTPGVKRYTREEFEQIFRENPEKGRALLEAGRVKWNNPVEGR